MVLVVFGVVIRFFSCVPRRRSQDTNMCPEQIMKNLEYFIGKGLYLFSENEKLETRKELHETSRSKS